MPPDGGMRAWGEDTEKVTTVSAVVYILLYYDVYCIWYTT
jgi:hypothetical protein